MKKNRPEVIAFDVIETLFSLVIRLLIGSRP
jgi:hypothetical protein